MFMSLGLDVHFLYVQEMPMRMDPRPYEESLSQTRAFWGDRFHLFTVSKMQKLIFNFRKEYHRLFTNNYFKVDDYYPAALTPFVEALQRKHQFDICIVNYCLLTKLFEKVSFPMTAVNTHDCFAYKDLKVGELYPAMTAHEEAKAMQRCQNLICLQDEEAAYFHLLSPKSRVFNFYGNFDFTPLPVVGNHNIVFLSGNNTFNKNGIRWFLQDIFPLVRKKYADAKLVVGGSICKYIKSLGLTDGVELIGFVDDPADLYKQGDIAINPIYQGTGLKIKTFEAISFNKVTLVHPHSRAGVFKKDQAPLFATDKPADWVAFLDKVWSDPQVMLDIKARNKTYLEEMNEFIMSEYKRFLEE